jgi:hypothetical protein
MLRKPVYSSITKTFISSQNRIINTPSVFPKNLPKIISLYCTIESPGKRFPNLQTVHRTMYPKITGKVKGTSQADCLVTEVVIAGTIKTAVDAINRNSKTAT